ncbi:penicillin-binding protein, transpeptidase domain protein [Collinsella intestinalis DSM 13280]|uniref:Penicillin-binding protein, transpeptidase domain protein n=2 Tax=Collinsella intestinalis TaxID=147207 RepID=C4FAT2_9ACTN|nr:FtsW/RodA/SpoVE family cell cycle protein [Collinsella intestinalis]EEP44075.1 penicillin-binding protein, transpeptidase domain protein [Collinsella intestinalis DSM 13280]
MSRRTTELLLLIAAAFPVTLLYAMYVVTTGAALSFQTLAVPLGLFAAFAAAHIGVRIFAPGADPAILPVVFTLSGIGITFVTRLQPDASLGQVIFLFLGVALMVGTLAVVKNLEVIKRYKYVLGIAGIILLVLPMFIGTEIYGSKLWIKIGGFQFQPGEFAKVLIVLFLAGYLAENRELLSISNRTVLGIKFPRLRLLYPLFIVWGVCLLVVAFERDLGSALLFYTIFLIMLYVATGRVSYVIIGLALLAVGAFGMYQIMSHVQVRVAIWLDPFSDAQNLGYQIVQSLFSLADGGLAGVGIGKGMADIIPVVASDMIFAAIGEEMGLLGGSAVLLLFMLFAVRGLTTAARAKSDLAAFSAAGLTAAISFQAFTIVGGVTKLIPLTGVTLPFMSQGGSSLLASFVIVALLLRAGDEATGRSTEIANTSTDLATAGYRTTVRGSHMRRPALDTPESGLLGRVALANRLTRTVFLFTALFAVLIGNITYIQVIKASEYQDMPSNNHTINKARFIKRGSIITADGLTLAESIQQADGTYARSYPNGNLAAHVVGYYSQQYGTMGIENTQNDTLTGSKDYSSWQNALNSLAGISEPGNSVQLTIDSRIQRAAEQALAGRVGAIVALDPRSGAVLAWASAPTFDNTNIQAAIEAANASGGADTSMYDRATLALYTPGSTFKVLTLASALENGLATLDTTYDSPGRMEIGGADVVSIGERGHGKISLAKAFALSSNTVFGQVADGLGAEKLVATARAFGYGQQLGLDFTTAASVMPNPEEMTEWELAWAGAGQPVGQGHTPGPQATVMQNALMAATIANNGIAMNPYVVSQILAPDGTVLKTTRGHSLGQAVGSGTAEQVKQAMLDVVQNGTGSAAAIAGVKVAGKTGTAETNNANANSTFVGFAPYDTPTVAIAVVIEQNAKGEESAAAVGGQVLRAALATQGL